MMDEIHTIITLVLGIFAGVLMAFGLVLAFVFLGSDDMACRSALYGFISLL